MKQPPSTSIFPHQQAEKSPQNQYVLSFNPRVLSFYPVNNAVGPRRPSLRGPTVTRIGSVPALVLLEALVRATNLGLRLFAADPVRALDALAGLKILVDLKEMLDLQAVEL